MIAHWMPCKIEAKEMNVDADLMTVDSLGSQLTTLNSNPVLTSNFRGRPLRGVQLDFPESYCPVIVHHSGIVSDEPEAIKFGQKLDKVILWNLSTPPSFSDPIPLSLTWLHLANVLHSQS
ncbi:unnamed protein product [Heterobilharzia americana]|nr:unnamed protein product [Heterobilharzia americana]CAH8479518.1 unnamed protein product [Heterobilharzia americana]